MADLPDQATPGISRWPQFGVAGAPAWGIRPPRPLLIAASEPQSIAAIERCLDALRLTNLRLRARDGDDVVAILAARITGRCEPPALLLVDDDLAGKSPQEVLNWMGSQPTLSSVPVVMLVGTSTRESLRAAHAAGVTSVLTKPVAYAAMIDVIRGFDAPWQLS